MTRRWNDGGKYAPRLLYLKSEKERERETDSDKAGTGQDQASKQTTRSVNGQGEEMVLFCSNR